MVRMWIVRRSGVLWALVFSSGLLVSSSAGSARAQDDCFERIDNGVDLSGWQKSPTNPHGPGDGWTVEDGALVGRQTEGQQGGILMTEASYRDVEVLLEVRVDWGCDSGLFLRTTDGSRAYQVTIDHLGDSAVGTIWGESFPEQLREIPYWLTDEGSTAIPAPDRHEEPIFDLAQWSSLWDPTAFNELRARIEHNPPRIQVWIAGTQVMDFTDSAVRDYVAAEGPLAIQVHSGGRWIQDGTVAFRNIRVRDLSAPCDAPAPGGSGGDGSVGGRSTGGQSAGGLPSNPAGASGFGGASAGGTGAGGLRSPGSGSDDLGSAGHGASGSVPAPSGDGGRDGGGSGASPGIAGRPPEPPTADPAPAVLAPDDGDGFGGGASGVGPSAASSTPSSSAGASSSSSGGGGGGCGLAGPAGKGSLPLWLLAAIGVRRRRRTAAKRAAGPEVNCR